MFIPHKKPLYMRFSHPSLLDLYASFDQFFVKLTSVVKLVKIPWIYVFDKVEDTFVMHLFTSERGEGGLIAA